MAVYDATTARALLERAIAHESKPTLAPADVDLLMQTAASPDELGATVYTSAALTNAAAVGWSWKAGLVADAYDLGGGSGIYLKRDQWYAHCQDRQAAYQTGRESVDGTGTRGRGGIFSIPVISSMAVDA